MGKKKAPKKIGRIMLIILGGLLVLGGSALAGWWLASQHQASIGNPTTTTDVPKATQPSKDNDIRLIATGDMLAHDSINNNAKTGDDYDYTKFFKEVKQFTSSGDIRFCNQEGLSAGEAFGITGYPSFNAPTAFPRDLQKIGCNTINLANNHMADKGQPAIDATIASWESLKPLAVSGANRTVQERDTVKYIDVKGVRVAFVTFNELNNNQGAVAHSITMLEEPVVTDLMTKARADADFVMVSVHWGSYEDSKTVGPIQEVWTKRLVELGADAVIGTGPHVLQKTEWRDGPDGRKAFVWYSLGNFLSAQLTLEQRISGIAMMNIEKTGDEKIPAKITKVGFLPTYMHYDWSAADRAAEKLETRKNLMLYPLDKAADPLSRSGFKTTVTDQEKIIRDTLGKDVTLLTSVTVSSF